MIVVDPSALIAIARDEPTAGACMQALEEVDRVLISAATITESLIVAYRRGIEPQMNAVRSFRHRGRLRHRFHAPRRRTGFRRYGKGWDAAALNSGDSFSYALAKEHGCGLLYVGGDFGKTDVEQVIS